MPITSWPIIVFVVPPPRPGDDLSCFQHRWELWDVVEANGVPQPGAYAHHLKGSSYEEFLCVSPPGPPTPRPATPCQRIVRPLRCAAS